MRSYLVMLALSLGALVSGMVAPRALSQRVTPCVEACRTAAASARDRCARELRCQDRARFDERRCALGCDTTMNPVERCREECDIQSDACDAGCRDEPTDGERRGCLRRCGSRYHHSCPRECDEPPPMP